AVGGALYQEDANGEPKLKGIFSTTLRDEQTRWKVFDIEAFALISGLRRWKHLLADVEVVAVSDHKGLSTLFSDRPNLNGRSARWVEELLPFNVQLRHARGEEFIMAFPDYLSRETGAGEKHR